MPTVYDLLRARFGGQTESIENPEVAQSTNADAIFLRQDPRRVAFIVANLSANPIFIRPNAVAGAGAGITCPAGSLTTVAYPDDLHLAALEWHCVSPAGNSAMTYYAVRYTEAPSSPITSLGEV